MYYAVQENGARIHIHDAKPHGHYTCPACGECLIVKRGSIVTPHFAHKAGKHCDPWYSGSMSPWHLKMQSLFHEDFREQVLKSDTTSEFHIADIALQTDSIDYVFEFQHSPISQTTFLERTHYYWAHGYKVVWVFDFINCRIPKCLMLAEYCSDTNLTRIVWPGKDRVKFLDRLDFQGCEAGLTILFHVNTGEGVSHTHVSDLYYPWSTWEYRNPLERTPMFLSLDFSTFESSANFYATAFDEDAYRDNVQLINRTAIQYAMNNHSDI